MMPHRPFSNPRPADRLSCVRGVLFEADNVLSDATAWRRWLLSLLGRMGLHTHYDIFFGVWEAEFLIEVHRGSCSHDAALRSYLRAVGLSSGQLDEVIAASVARRRELDSSVVPKPGVRRTIAGLHGLRLGVLSNTEETALLHRRRLARLGLADRFDVILTSADLGCAMPERACFLAALEAMQLEASEVAFVGYNAPSLTGAASKGMPTVSVVEHRNLAVDCRLDRLDQLMDVLRPQAETAVLG